MAAQVDRSTATVRDSVALITGGAGVIGTALARYLVAEGAVVTVADVDTDRGKALASELDCFFIEVDVGDIADNQRMVAATVERHRRLDLVFLNAGVSLRGLRADLPYDPAAIDVDAYRRILSVNIDGPVYGIAAAIPALTKPGGSIIVTSSIAGLTAWPADPVYTISKHGLVGYVRSLAPSLEQQGITINAICPGLTAHLDNDRLPEGLAVLAPETLAAAMVGVATDGGTGRAASVVADRDLVVQFHEFGEVEGFETGEG